MLHHISWHLLSLFALLPLMLFTAAPLYQLIRDSVDPPQITHFWTDSPHFSYAYTIDTISSVAAVIGLFIILIDFGKAKQLRRRLKTYLQQNLPMCFFLLFLLWMMLSACINGFTAAALHGDSYRNESLFTYAIYFLVYFFCGTLVTSAKHKRILFYFFLSVSVVLAVSAIIHSWIAPLPAYAENVGLSTVFHQFNHYGYFLLFGNLLSGGLFATESNGKAKVFCLFVFLLNNVVLILNDTFGCYLAVFVALIFQNIVLWRKDKHINSWSLILLAAFFLVSLVMSIRYDTVFHNVFRFFQDIGDVAENPTNSEGAGTGRWSLWTHTLQYISEKPLFGFGVEGIHDRLELETNYCNNRPHNEYLQYAAFFGIPALLLYLCGIVSVYIRAWKQRAKSDACTIVALIAAFGYLVSACFGNTMYYTTPFFFLLLGFGWYRSPLSSAPKF